VHALDHLPIPRCTSVHRDSKGRWTVSWKHKKPFPETAPGGGYKDQFESEAIAPPSARERAILMGFPPDMVCTRACDQTESRRKLEDKRCSLLENASHVPSVMVVMSLAHALLPPPEPIPRPIYAAFEARLRGAAQGTVWQPGLLDSWPGVLSSAALLAHVRQSFSELNVALPDLHTSNDMDLALRRLQVYWVDSQIRGRQAFDQGPCWAQQKARAASAVSLGVQKGGPTSKHAPEPLLPTGLSKETHVQLSSCLPFPFESEVVLDDDMSFAVKGMYVLGPCIRAWRRQQRRALETLAKWLQPWDVELRKHMCPAVAAVAANKSPALIAALTALLRWPDVALASRFVTGFALLGDVEVPHIFRPIHQTGACCGKVRPIDNGKVLPANSPSSWRVKVPNCPDEVRKEWPWCTACADSANALLELGVCSPAQALVECSLCPGGFTDDTAFPAGFLDAGAAVGFAAGCFVGARLDCFVSLEV
ncbi:unnamed protein product, partial [Symbiodinium necroappetens]